MEHFPVGCVDMNEIHAVHCDLPMQMINCLEQLK